jgi:hypothetical protein
MTDRIGKLLRGKLLHVSPGVMMTIVIAVIVLAWLIGPGFNYERNKIISMILMYVGLVTFVGVDFLPLTGNLLNHIELPAFFQTTTIVLGDSRRYALTVPIRRVQRYSAAGEFEAGWFVKSQGGMSEIGETANGYLVIASARTKSVEVFNVDGSIAAESKLFSRKGATLMGGAMLPENYEIDGISIVPSTITTNPPATLMTLLLIPLWSPGVAWLFTLFGALIHPDILSARKRWW